MNTNTPQPPTESATASCSALDELFAPLHRWADNLFGAGLIDGKIVSDVEGDSQWEELRAEQWSDGTWSVTYAPADDGHSWEIYRGHIPDRRFWLSLLRNGECGGFRNLPNSVLDSSGVV